MDKNIEVSVNDIVRVCNILDSLRVSLDQIGSVNSQGRDKMLRAMGEYFTPEVYREIADSWSILAKILEKEIGWDEFIKSGRRKKIPNYQAKKY